MPGTTSAPVAATRASAPPAALAAHAPASVAIVIPVLNARRFLPAVIPSVLRAAQRSGITEIVAVDNGSTDGSAEYLEATWAGAIRVLRTPGARVGEVRNVGARATTAELLSFVDADCVLDEDYYEEARVALADPSVDATGARYELPHDPLWIERVWDAMHREARPNGPVDYLNAGNFVVRRAAFDAVGGFDAHLESGEDAELGQRLRRGGARIVSCARVRARHLGNPKTLTGFVRKQRWHAMGMFGTVDARSVDKPTIMLAAHLLLPLAVVALVVAGVVAVPLGLALAAASTLVVPAASVAYRWRRAARPEQPLAAVFLYWLYFYARASALVRIALAPFRR